MSISAALAVFGTIFVAVMWMIIGWKAMAAHERLADAAEEIARKLRDPDQPTKE